jgi:hypothetical protein
VDETDRDNRAWRRQYSSIRAGLFVSMLFVTAVIFYALYHRHHTEAAFIASASWLLVDLAATVLLLRQAHRRLLRAYGEDGTR